MIGLPLTPDGARYLSLAQGTPMPYPFSMRAGWPRLCGLNPRAWRLSAALSVLAMAAGTAWLVGGWKGVAAGAMVAALPMNKLNLRYPVLVDAPALACAVLAAACFAQGWILPALVLVCVAACIKETAPIFAALYAWSPVLLVGMAIPLLLVLTREDGPDVPGMDPLGREVLQHPLRVGLRLHADQWRNPVVMALPWGSALLGLCRADWQVGTCLAVAYAQLCIATDSVRLYQWAAPVLCGAAVRAVPEAALPLLVAGVWWNPWAGEGS